MKKRLFAALLAGAVAISLMACGGSGSSSSSAPAADAGAAGTGEAAPAAAAEAGDGSYTIDVICKTLSSEYWSYIKAGAEAYAKEHPEVTVEVKGPPSETSYDEQMNMIQTDLGSGGYDGYIIAPLQADTVKTLIADTDAPVMALDSAIPSDKVISFIGTGNEEAAKAGAAAAVEAAKAAGWEEIKCIEIAGVQGDGTNTARMNGYIAGIEENGAAATSLKTKSTMQTQLLTLQPMRWKASCPLIPKELPSSAQTTTTWLWQLQTQQLRLVSRPTRTQSSSASTDRSPLHRQSWTAR